MGLAAMVDFRRFISMLLRLALELTLSTWSLVDWVLARVGHPPGSACVQHPVAAVKWRGLRPRRRSPLLGMAGLLGVVLQCAVANRV